MPIRFSDLQLIAKLITAHPVNWTIADEHEAIIWDKSVPTHEQGRNILVTQGNLSKLAHTAPYLIRFGTHQTHLSGYKKITFRYICNRDQSIRWIYPDFLQTPTFLNFYCAATYKAKLTKKALQLGHYLNLHRWITHGSFQIYYKESLFLNQLLNTVPHTGFSIFMGTIGPNRKLLIELNHGGKTTHFIKLGLNQQSSNLVHHEITTLQRLEKLRFHRIQTPAAKWCSEFGYGLVENIRFKPANQHNRLQEIHFSALTELYQQTATHTYWENSSIHQQVGLQLKQVKQQPHFYRVESLVTALVQLKNQLPSNLTIPMAMAHGDFTPWNMFTAADHLAIYDWEMTIPQAPLLYDIFHFVFQSTVMLKNGSWDMIKSKLAALAHSTAIKKLTAPYSINFQLHLQLYLLINVSYYLNIYAQQETLHVQAYQLLHVWDHALRDLLAEKSQLVACKSTLINDLTQKIKNYDYVALKNQPEVSNPHSDIDLLVQEKDLPTILTFIQHHHTAKKVLVNRKSFMVTLSIFFHDDSFLSIDLLTKFRRKGVEYLAKHQLLNSSVMGNSGFKQPSLKYDFEYTWLFYLLNYSDLPEKYQRSFHQLSASQQTSITHYLNQKYALGIQQLTESFHYQTHHRKCVLASINQQVANQGWRKFQLLIRYCLDIINQRKGMVLTVNGVDGVGKSTIIEQLKVTLGNKFRKNVVVLRHRPSLLPILSAWKYGAKKAEERSMQHLPHSGTNTNVISSLARFAYYYLDYFFGQFYVYVKYIMRGQVVIYDRYYFDFINDPRRSNISIPSWLSKALFRYLLKPKLNIFLYADADEVYRRKQEVPKHKIRTLTQAYLNLFNTFEKKYRKSVFLSIENNDQQKTIDDIIHSYTQLA